MIEDKKVVEIDNVEAETPAALTLDLSETARTNIWINGDCTKVIRLNLTDMGVMSRLQDAYPKLDELTAEVQNLASADISDKEIVATFKKIDQQMKDIVDDIFDYPVSEVCCDGGSMYDPVGGQLRFEYIIDRISKLYEASLNDEFKKMQAKMKAHTAKYTKSSTKKRK